MQVSRALPEPFRKHLEQIRSPEFPENHSPVRQDALGDLTHQDEEQHEGQDPAQVVPREVEPRAVVDVYLRALTAPSCKERQEQMGSLVNGEEGA
ncbi:hypothetical protein MDA_GLEAN10004047 [Myotis davidii]|uniref:Uncharacterized protein n=1 Tax=Myotis davidii TaxID=225400 RepID=L5LK17_MYODS|nr:hypothetical protein MDA_GLEAN10004047 [Myotis davidii]